MSAGPQLTASLTLDSKGYEKVLVRAERAAIRFASRLTGLGSALAGVGFTAGIANAYEYGRQMLNLSRATGISTSKVAVFAQALQDSSLSANEIIVAMRLMSQHLLKAAEGQTEAVHAFNQIGVSWKELLHLPMEDAFEKVGRAIAATENPALRSAAAIRHFGDTGAKTLKLFARGGALDFAKEALGGQAGVIAQSAGTFEKIALRLSHIGVKLRGVFVGIAESIMPMMDKFTDIFHKMDFTDWGKRLGAAINNAMAWVVTFWKEPELTLGYFWEYSKLRAMEWGNVLLDKLEMFKGGLGASVLELTSKTVAWGEIFVGYAIDFGETLTAGVNTFVTALRNGWEATGIPDVMRWLKSQQETGAQRDKRRNSEWGFEPAPGTPDIFNKRKPAGGGVSQAVAIAKAVATTMANPSIGAALIKKGQADLARAGIPQAFLLGQDHTGVGAQEAKVAGMRNQLAPARAEARRILEVKTPINRISEFIAAMQYRMQGQWRHSSLMGSSMAGDGFHNLSRGAYGASDILRHRERVGFRNQAIAARSGRILASGGRDTGPYYGDFSDKRRPGETANGDRQRAKAFAREIARREAGQGTDNQLLGDISRNTSDMNKKMDVFK